MCGISGIYNVKGNGDWSNPVAQMNTAQAHRGPDDYGVFAAPGIALGHRRLSIIDLSAAGHQPMSYAGGRYTMVYNGELYNYRELKAELADVVFHTATDSEVILAAYARWKENCLDKFNGMFAFAIWDQEAQTLFIARDRLGIKPLYYWFQNDTLVFASELRSVLASGLPERIINKRALHEYLCYQTVHAPSTLVSGVQLLLPGSYIRAAAGGMSVHTWWAPGVAAASQQPREEPKLNDVYGTISTLLTKAVERRLVADVPFGAFLSGGIDSSAVVGLMSRITGNVKTFNVSFDESEFSEAVYARMVAKRFGTEHTEIRLTPADFLNDLPAALLATDHPGGDGPNTYIVSKATKAAGVTMALSGLGGDELFAGYPIFKRAFTLRDKAWVGNLPLGLRKLAGNTLQRLKPGVASAKTAELLGLPEMNFDAAYALSRRVLLQEQFEKLLQDKNATVPQLYFDHFFEKDETHLISHVSLAEICTYMQNVLLRDTDQMSMAHALEVRVPFLDYTLVEYVLGLPDKIKYADTPKRLLVESLGDLLPPEIVNRPKMGFTLPWEHWMKNELRGFCDEQLAVLKTNSFFSSEGISSHWQRFLAGDKHVTWSRVWHLVVLGHWMKTNQIEIR